MIDGFEIIKDYGDRVFQKVLRQKARSEFYLMRRYMTHLKLFKFRSYVQRQNEAKADQFIKMKRLSFKKLIIKKMKKILYIERKWLSKVQNEFNI